MARRSGMTKPYDNGLKTLEPFLEHTCRGNYGSTSGTGRRGLQTTATTLDIQRYVWSTARKMLETLEIRSLASGRLQIDVSSRGGVGAKHMFGTESHRPRQIEGPGFPFPRCTMAVVEKRWSCLTGADTINTDMHGSGSVEG